MKALVVADRGTREDLAAIAKREQVDLIISLGDFTRQDVYWMTALPDLPKIGVYGNHCSGQYMEEIGIMNMHMHKWEFMGKTFVGFQGCVRYKENPYAIMYTQAEAAQLISQLPKADIVVSHCPPRGINDEEELAHQGFDALRTYLDTYRPAVLLHGHTYPEAASIIKDYQGTRIEYVSGYRIITL